MTFRHDLIDRYRSYLDACNQRAWDELRLFLAETVIVNARLSLVR